MMSCETFGIVGAGRLDAYCLGSEAAMLEHADALLVDGGPMSRITGAIVVKQWDTVACPVEKSPAN